MFCLFLRYDYFSVPQIESRQEASCEDISDFESAVRSIPAYVEMDFCWFLLFFCGVRINWKRTLLIPPYVNGRQHLLWPQNGIPRESPWGYVFGRFEIAGGKFWWGRFEVLAWSFCKYHCVVRGNFKFGGVRFSRVEAPCRNGHHQITQNDTMVCAKLPCPNLKTPSPKCPTRIIKATKDDHYSNRYPFDILILYFWMSYVFTQIQVQWLSECSQTLPCMLMVLLFLSRYVEMSSVFMVLCPLVPHREMRIDGQPVTTSFSTWCDRGWCRAECVSRVRLPIPPKTDRLTFIRYINISILPCNVWQWHVVPVAMFNLIIYLFNTRNSL